MGNKSYIVKSIILIVSIISLGILVSYAYYNPLLLNKDSSQIIVTSDDVKLIYSNGSTISAKNILPGWSAAKNFQVNVESKKAFSYDINLVINSSNFYTSKADVNGFASSYLEYALYECSGLGSGCSTLVTDYTLISKNNGIVVTGSPNKANGTYYYQLVVRFTNNETKNQIQVGSDGKELSFDGYVTLSSSAKV